MIDIEKELHLGLEHHRAGRIEQARDCYRAVLDASPNNPDALNLLGVLAGQLGQVEAALTLMHKAVTVAPEHIGAMVNLGNLLQGIGRHEEALSFYDRAVEVNPDWPECQNNRGNALAAVGRKDEAEESFRRAVELRPDFAEAHNNLGNLLGETSPEQAIKSYRTALSIKPDYAEALNNLAKALQELHRLDEAIEVYREALALMPGAVAIHHNMGTALQDAGRMDDARDCYTKALALQPDHSESHYNLGIVEERSGNFDAAIDSYRSALNANPSYAEANNNLGNCLLGRGDATTALTCFESAIECRADYVAAIINRGNALRALKRTDEAMECYREALIRESGNVDCLVNMGNAYLEKNEAEEAVGCYREAIKSRPGDPNLLYNLANALAERGQAGDLREASDLYQKAIGANPDFLEAHQGVGRLLLMRLCDANAAIPHFEKAARLAGDGTTQQSAYLMAMHYAENVTAKDIAEEHARFGRALPAPDAPPTRERGSKEPLRVGLLSGDFYHHATAFFLMPLLENRDGRQWEAHLYSNATVEDGTTARFRKLADSFTDIRPMKDSEAAENIRSDGMDILIDLNGHTRGNRLGVLARRPAPIQASWLDYVGTTGLEQIDFLISDPHHITKQMERLMAETVIRLPNDCYCYEPPKQAPEVAPAPFLQNGFVTFGCFNAAFKIGPQSIEAWSSIMRGVEGSRLVLSSQAFRYDDTRERFLSLFAAHGIPAERIDLLGPATPEEMLERYALIDIALDSFPYSGGLTTLESLWMGVPVITFPGDRVAGRHATSHLRNCGLDSLIADDRKSYIARVQSLAADTSEMKRLRGSVRDSLAAAPVTDGKKFNEDFSVLLERMALGRTG
ncbi:MAG: tetratricopeptide repeat protein [Rhodospirillales bacterium]|nr:tetratricopeptide repeat protein [Rhodospirillales bacterium]MCW8952907.1 tetratricopeptide repeat protein [Rhodospirillales bacterium]MCW9002557.1 tetratricopeptide repeat protein [Rhodospirillales bacterium]